MPVTISIHAPTRGATYFSEYTSMAFRFQSTLPQGERLPNWCSMLRLLYFNPRSHKGSDLIGHSVKVFRPISIHAPTRGATPLPSSYRQVHRFQSTLPQGERPKSWSGSAIPVKFQSTLPQGERRAEQRSSNCAIYFNPRSHKGSDISSKRFVLFTINFNPRSHKGSDLSSE